MYLYTAEAWGCDAAITPAAIERVSPKGVIPLPQTTSPAFGAFQGRDSPLPSSIRASAQRPLAPDTATRGIIHCFKAVPVCKPRSREQRDRQSAASLIRRLARCGGGAAARYRCRCAATAVTNRNWQLSRAPSSGRCCRRGAIIDPQITRTCLLFGTYGRMFLRLRDLPL
ncbi:hypothetical protein AAFF_G00007210 [Aldrovandia affinis]|uniref:Uncharacterized protein n=1 Tax=Aldrovandia affinis TaxID=143900 RepID=A0AAD7T6T0_9TELE|nr:hypothetical protein AAFF_G00007210 [Aldrovandia affinis]